MYNIGDLKFFVRILPNCDLKEIIDVRVRTINANIVVVIENEKANTYMLSAATASSCLFDYYIDAKTYLSDYENEKIKEDNPKEKEEIILVNDTLFANTCDKMPVEADYDEVSNVTRTVTDNADEKTMTTEVVDFSQLSIFDI